MGTTVKHDGSLGYIKSAPFRGNARQRATRSRVLHMLPYALGVVVVVLVLWGVGSLALNGFSLFTASSDDDEELSSTVLIEALTGSFNTPPDQAVLQVQSPGAVVLDPGSVSASGRGHATFSAVGDNIANENLLELADAASGETDDEQYDFTAFYDGIRDTVQSYDISFINQETTLGGDDRYGYNGYPTYNTPDSMADAIASTGWDVVSTDSNHTYDTGTEAIEHSLETWNAKADDLITIGSFASEEERSRIRMVECNGVRVAFLAYCYGQNGYDQSDLPNDYYAVPYVTEDMQEDVAAAREVADAVVVYMHWGAEYDHDPDETQLTRAQELADAGVDVVIGSHAHVIQPMTWLEGADGGQTLVVYGLGDVWSGYQDNPQCIFSGMMTCEFVRLSDDEAASSGRKVSVENVVWHPLIEHWENNTDTVYLLSDYTEEQAEANELLSSLDDPYTWMQELTEQVIGDEFEIDM